MRYLLDTDRVASYLNGRVEAVSLLSSIRQDGLAISLITYGEIYDGIYGSRDPQSREHAFQEFIRRVAVLPLTRPSMRRFANIRGGLRRQSMSLGDTDLLIAATALHHELALATGNYRHFERVPGLLLYRG